MEYLELINDLVNALGDDLESIFLVGSQSLPFIKNKRDSEVYIVVKPETIDIHIVDIFKLRAKWYDRGVGITHKSMYERVKEELPVCTCLEHYQVLLYGKEQPLVFDILSNRQRYYNSLKYWAMKWYQDTPPKYFYHILMGIYILENNSYEFTEKQIENINILHDMEDQEKVNQLVNWIKNDYFNVNRE